MWLQLPEGARADRVAAEPFATTRHTPQAIRLALGSADLDTLPGTLHRVVRAADLDAAR